MTRDDRGRYLGKQFFYSFGGPNLFVSALVCAILHIFALFSLPTDRIHLFSALPIRSRNKMRSTHEDEDSEFSEVPGGTLEPDSDIETISGTGTDGDWTITDDSETSDEELCANFPPPPSPPPLPPPDRTLRSLTPELESQPPTPPPSPWSTSSPSYASDDCDYSECSPTIDPKRRKSATPESVQPCECLVCCRPPSPSEPWRPPSPQSSPSTSRAGYRSPHWSPVRQTIPQSPGSSTSTCSSPGSPPVRRAIPPTVLSASPRSPSPTPPAQSRVLDWLDALDGEFYESHQQRNGR